MKLKKGYKKEVKRVLRKLGEVSEYYEAYKFFTHRPRYRVRCIVCGRVIEKGEEMLVVGIRLSGTKWTGKRTVNVCRNCLEMLEVLA